MAGKEFAAEMMLAAELEKSRRRIEAVLAELDATRRGLRPQEVAADEVLHAVGAMVHL
jgi:hypothetical protein